VSLSNGELAELLYAAAEEQTDQRQRALRRAARYALVWPEEARAMKEEGRSLTELPAVGPWVGRAIHALLDDPPDFEIHPLRSGFITYADAKKVLEEDPSWKDELRGDLQMHSTYSDGSVSISEMAGGATSFGYEYISITDHSKGLKIAGGIDEYVLGQQAAEIADVNLQLDDLEADLTVLRSIELNFDRDGGVDMENDALDELDIVVGSFHSRLRVKEDQTDRVLGAVRHPHVQIIGHPKGRMFGVRAGVQGDWERIIEEGTARGKAFEINAQPNRQDFSIEMLKLANAAGATFSIGTDAHSVGELYNVDLALASAALAEIPKERIINYLALPDLLAWVAESRETARSQA
jgi:histidinol phosphatase-like PHP family hydrolase